MISLFNCNTFQKYTWGARRLLQHNITTTVSPALSKVGNKSTIELIGFLTPDTSHRNVSVCNETPSERRGLRFYLSRQHTHADNGAIPRQQTTPPTPIIIIIIIINHQPRSWVNANCPCSLIRTHVERHVIPSSLTHRENVVLELGSFGVVPLHGEASGCSHSYRRLHRLRGWLGDNRQHHESWSKKQTQRQVISSKDYGSVKWYCDQQNKRTWWEFSAFGN